MNGFNPLPPLSRDARPNGNPNPEKRPRRGSKNRVVVGKKIDELAAGVAADVVAIGGNVITTKPLDLGVVGVVARGSAEIRIRPLNVIPGIVLMDEDTGIIRGPIPRVIGEGRRIAIGWGAARASATAVLITAHAIRNKNVERK
jgi:hypothetical protein